MNRAVIFSTLAISALLTRAEDKIDFAKQVQPILEKRCLECHNAEKTKGDLRFDEKAEAFKADKVIVAGKPDESSLFKRISLPAGHDDIMPPKGDPLTKEQIELLKKWI